MPITLNGTSQYFTIGTTTLPNETNGQARATFITWFRPSTLKAAIIYAALGSNGFVSITMTAAGAIAAGVWGNAGTANSNLLWTSAAGFITANKTHMLIMSVDGTQATSATKLRIFLGVDGVVTEVTATGTYSGVGTFTSLRNMSITGITGGPIRFGSTGASSFFEGCFFDQAWYATTAASVGQVSEAYNAGTPPDLSTTTLGTPTHWYKLLVDVNDSGTATARNGTVTGGPLSFTCAIGSPLTITPSSIDDGLVGVPYTQTLEATGGGAGTYAWTITAGALPTGLSLGSSAVATVAISGTPRVSGTFTFTVGASEDGGTVYTQAYTVSVVGTVRISPILDVLRGGRRIALSTQLDLGNDDDDQSLTSAALPTGWTSSGFANPTVLGLELTTRAASATSSIATNGAHASCDVAVDVLVEHPRATPGANTTVAQLDLVGATTTARLRTVVDTTGVVRMLFELLGGATTSYGILQKPISLLSSWFTLRLVRHQDRTWAFFGRRGFESADEYEELELIGSAPFVTADATVEPQFAVTGVHVRSRWRHFTVRGHATINGRLVEEKAVRFMRQIVCRVPEAPLDEVGAADVVVFGASGYAVSADVVGSRFTYVLPDSALVSSTLSTATDAAVFTGERRRRRRGG